MENNFNKNIESIFSSLEKFIKTKTVIGEPIVVGEVTLIPIISVMFGCGSGSGNGTDNKGMNGTGNGGGGGAKISPNGIVVIKNGEVSMLPVKSQNGLEALVAMVPEIVTKLDLKKDKNDIEEDKENN
ncbi:spore germination protein GerW family protein [Clostridium sp. SM-530-WT-3G]|uniref:GerW family sporulation protein n=1 Tax=Clostridium sp. SM-530-WT-3G TaxID=2725303 RepID=UPI00145D05F7|nr:spore germination protein GerW family protein [Clostridium sp. SM-530-WT-3G]NME82518.1 sporulation protein [Clostridium sp. SM-530-WT-3G]